MAFHTEQAHCFQAEKERNPLQILVILHKMSREAAIERETMEETLLQ